MLSKLTLPDPSWPLHDLWTQQRITLWSRILPTKFGGHRSFLSNWPLVDPSMTSDPQQCIMLWSGFFPPTLVAIGHCWANWPLLDPSWLLHDLWPQQCITLWSGVLPTKFSGHKALLSKLTPTWPQLTPTWPLTPPMHYVLNRNSSHQIWWP